MGPAGLEPETGLRPNDRAAGASPRHPEAPSSRVMTYQPVSLESLLSHQGWAMRVARRLVREEGEAEDLVQRTWIAALQRPPQSENGARAWIRKVILNLARERHRRNRVRMRFEENSRA